MYRVVGLLLFIPLLADSAGWIDGVLDQAVAYGAIYPAILGILIIASLGVPIPEDVPLILAGVILATEPRAATWTGVLTVSLLGIMSGDLVLYTLGRKWGRDVFNHRWVNRLVTPDRFDWLVEKFHSYGVWACFFGRFLMGIRAAMCLTAGATRFPYWKFFLADFAGALLSVPFFVWLGYLFGNNWPVLLEYMKDTQGIVLGAIVVLAIAGFFWWKMKHVAKLGRKVAPAAGRDGGGSALPETELPTERRAEAAPRPDVAARAESAAKPARGEIARNVLNSVSPLGATGGSKK